MNGSDVNDSSLEIVPLDSNYIPLEKAVANALNELGTVISEREECHQWTSDYVQVMGLFDSDEQEMICPSCGRKDTLSAGIVFSLGEMLFVQPADEIELTMTCCGSVVMLSSLDFGDSPRFARFGITILNRSSKLDDTTLYQLGDLLGCPVAQVCIQE